MVTARLFSIEMGTRKFRVYNSRITYGNGITAIVGKPLYLCAA